MMNNKIKNIGWLYVIVFMVLNACGISDSEKEWGVAKIYMPQAAILNGGLSHDYPVPLKNNVATENYELDSITNILRVTLGVYRSGLQPLKAYSVSVQADRDATNAAVSSISRGVELPVDVYSLPSTITVPDGEREGIFTLDIDLNKILSDYPDYALNKLVLVVSISDPTNYELNQELSKTVVIIDGPSFLPAPKIVKGGNFEEGSKEHWKKVIFGGDKDYAGTDIRDGVLVFNYGTEAVRADIYFYTTIQLEKGKEYKFSCNFTNSGGDDVRSSRFYLVVSSLLPNEKSYSEDSEYPSSSHSFFSMLDAWNGMKNPIIGTLPQDGGWQGGIDKSTGIFTSNFSGTGYIIMGVAAWGSSIGTITIDNVEIEEH